MKNEDKEYTTCPPDEEAKYLKLKKHARQQLKKLSKEYIDNNEVLLKELKKNE